ncbi:LysR family transcriptional regulator [Marinobacter psychrophilus]|jgi:DNA-binding transcriptional LysR family regulator|uniref:LysR family transcriptional regulator n=1 Tax=Marinobacter psychrophilus TaxID=330734 RepID=A0A0H4I7Q1_9GAMM|nr:LysR family transcriptional regulator [Marinobacter psychrophilus]AKO53735.1 LysR family transcriptional regulator [Marinobacter psychrophilus]
MFSQRALTYLNEVIRRGSLRRAAAHLNVDASAVSRQLKALEEELNTRLCERHGRGMRATAAGQLLVHHFHAQRASEEAVLSQLMALQNLVKGEVRIAVGEGFIADLIAAPLGTFMSAFTGINVEIRMAGVNEAMSLLKDREVDIALLYAPPVDPQFFCHVETRQPLDVIVPPNHPLIELNRPVTLNDLKGWPLALMDNPFGMRQMVNMAAHQERVHLEARLHTNSVSVLKNFVRSGIGVTFMPELTVMDEIKRGEIFTLPMQYPVMNDTHAQIVSLKGQELTIASAACIDHLQKGMRFFSADAPRLLQ